MRLETANQSLRWRRAISVFVWLLVMISGTKTLRAQNKVVGELEFEGKTKLERDSGVWIYGNYVGYLKELKGSKKVTLLPGQHEVVVRQSGYQEYVEKIVVEPGQKSRVSVTIQLATHTRSPDT